MVSGLRFSPLTLREANAFVDAHHRHHGPARGCVFVLALSDAARRVRAVAIVGRPLSRMLARGGDTLEVTRVCTDGSPDARNACSRLYGRAWQLARGLGYARLVTYTLPSESGASLRGAGWQCIGEAGGGSWARTGRPRVDTHPMQTKLRWEAPAA